MTRFLLPFVTTWPGCWTIDEASSLLQCRVSSLCAHKTVSPALSHTNDCSIPDDNSSLCNLLRKTPRWQSASMHVGTEVVHFSGNFVTHGWDESPDITTALVDGKDYTHEVRLYMARHNRSLRGRLPSMPAKDAELEWERLVARRSSSSNKAIGNVSNLPRAVQDDLRRDLFQNLFNSSPGIIVGHIDENVTASMSREALVKKIGHLHVKAHAFSYPGWYFSLKPQVMTFREFAKRKVCRLRAEGSGPSVFINEPYLREPLLDHIKVFEKLRPTFLPLMPHYAIQPQAHHGIFMVDPIGSSHSFHYHGAVWNTQVVGRKAWWLLKPTYPPDSSRHYLAPSVGNVTFAQPNACAYLISVKLPPPALMFIQHPGQTFLLPENYWHATCALDNFTVAFGGWMSYQN